MPADHTVMRNMDIGHDQAVVSDLRNHACLCTPVQCAVLTDRHMIADLQIGFLTTEFEILWYCPDDCPGKDPAMPADPGTIHDGDIGSNPGVVTDHDIPADRCKRSYLNVFADLCFRMYDLHCSLF